MATTAARARKESGRARSELRARLEERREEIEAAALTRVRAISDPSEVTDPAYADGLRAAVAAAVAYGIETTGREVTDPPIPVALLAQARMAARVGIPLDTVLRRYFAGYSLLGYFILEEATNSGIVDGAEFQRVVGAHAGLFDRLLAAVGEEHGREAEAVRSSSERRQAEQIDRLLAGELVDTSTIPYDLEGLHLGVVASAVDAVGVIRSLARDFDCHSLCLPREDGVVWGWFGCRHWVDPEEILRSTRASGCGGTFALGEPGSGLEGWRLSHRQAVAAFPIAKRDPGRALRYRDIALLAGVERDELLTHSLRELYVTPLSERLDGDRLKETLGAYLSAERNVSSTAAALGVSRQTVRNRLRVAEELFARPLSACAIEVELALRLVKRLR